MTWLRSSIYFVFLSISIFIFGSSILIVSRFAPQPVIDRLAKSWACLNIWLQGVICGLKFEIHGREHLDNLPAIVMAKHQSAWETFALPCILPKEQSWILKKELLKIPFFGWVLEIFRSIPIDRNAGRRAIIQVVKDGLRNLKDQRTVIIFPEGTRTLPGEKGKYNLGGAVLAAKSEAHVIPIAHNGGVYWDAGGFKKYPGVIQVRIGSPISTKDKTSETIMAEVETWIETEMQALPAQR